MGGKRFCSDELLATGYITFHYFPFNLYTSAVSLIAMLAIRREKNRVVR